MNPEIGIESLIGDGLPHLREFIQGFGPYNF